MPHYLLSVHMVEGEPSPSMTHEEMEAFQARVNALEAEMEAVGAYVFGGALTGPGDARVVASSGGEVVTTDGPFAESKEHIGGIYLLETDDREAALTWAARTSAAVGRPIEVRPFHYSRGV